MPRRRAVLSAIGLLAISGAVSACGSESVSVPKSDGKNINAGAVLFAERCSGCHTLDVAGTQGSAVKVRGAEKTDGPNFNTRKETKGQVLYAIRNGGFSGAIMPQNIVVGEDAEHVAEFLSKYAGRQAKAPPAPSAPESEDSEPPKSETPEAESAPSPAGETSESTR